MISLKKGFTLIELMVVIAIIGILAAALITPITNARATGQAVRCKTNLKNLAQAALSYAGSNHPSRSGFDYRSDAMPWAGSYEISWAGGENVDYDLIYSVRLGWVSGTWTGPCPWDGTNLEPVLTEADSSRAQFYDKNWDNAYHSISNGVIWPHVGADLSTYVCDVHKKVAARHGCQNVLRSYVMNGYFGWNHFAKATGGSAAPKTAVGRTIYLNQLSNRGNAGALLLFAELPAYDPDGQEAIDTSKAAADGVLQTEIIGYGPVPAQQEMIGFNHRLAKRMLAHVAFADGHVDAIIAPDGASASDLKNLTFLLCNGLDVPSRKEDWKAAREEFN